MEWFEIILAAKRGELTPLQARAGLAADLLLSLSEVADRLRINKKLLQRHTKEGRLRARLVGRGYVADARDVLDYFLAKRDVRGRIPGPKGAVVVNDDLEKARRALEDLKGVENETKKKMAALGVIGEYMIALGAMRLPILVGGQALEAYTLGGYASGDVDIKGDKELLQRALTALGFVKEGGRHFLREDLGLYIEWVGGSLEEGLEAEERALFIGVSGNRRVRVVSVEDLIVDRLCSAKFWSVLDDRMWARYLLENHKALGLPVDQDYLSLQADKADVGDELRELREEVASEQGAGPEF